MFATTPFVLKYVTIFLMVFALSACAVPVQTQAKAQLAFVLGAAAYGILSDDDDSDPPTFSPNIARAPEYTPGTTHPAYRLGETNPFYMADCTGELCYRDIDSGELSNVLDSELSIATEGITFLHRRLQGSPDANGAQISVPEPPRDVRQAWRDGWIGDDVNMLIVDDFGSPSAPPQGADDSNGSHGYTTLMSAFEIARAADYHALESGTGNLQYGAGGVRNYLGETASASTKFHVVNHSFGLVNPSPTGVAPTQEELNAYIISAPFRDLLGSGQLNTADAVITKAAGNDGLDAGRFIDAVALATHRSTSPRALIVGALDGYARTDNPQDQPNVQTDARIASYSNRAGDNVEIQRRFLVEYGGTPYAQASGLCDAAVPVSQACRNPQILSLFRFDTRGTSFAAPRVAGFAALVRDKFPNLSGAHTANILLETATTMGLACHRGSARKSSSCSRSIYGQGRVDIGAALAPIGGLR